MGNLKWGMRAKKSNNKQLMTLRLKRGSRLMQKFILALGMGEEH